MQVLTTAPRSHRYMLACPGCVYLNRGNHESFDMNIRGFHEGGGFAQEATYKYDADVFKLFQAIFNLLPLATRINQEVLGALALHGDMHVLTTAPSPSGARPPWWPVPYGQRDARAYARDRPSAPCARIHQ